MCGVSGQFALAPTTPLNHGEAGRMAARLRHRGPEQAGQWDNEQVILDHRRLILLDAAGGAQPMAGDSAVMSYNGELYNHHELRDELAARGFRFNGRSDTEVVLAAYACFGDAAWDRFNGMFSLAIYDRREHTLRLLRDPLGIKPLFYSLKPDRLDFASEPAALDAQAAPDPYGLLHFLRFAQPVHADSTVAAGIRSVQPGERITFGPSMHSSSFGQAEPAASETFHPRTAKAKLRYLLWRAVERQAEADAPVGLFLSGGVDSAVLAGILRQLHRCPPRTYTVALENDEAELPAARQVADHFGSAHTELRVSPDRFFAAMRELTARRGLPVCYPNEVLIYELARTAGEQVKIALTGEGADELFGGYSRVLNSLGAYMAATVEASARKPLLLRSLAAEFPAADLSSSSRLFASLTAWWRTEDVLPLLRPSWRERCRDALSPDPFAAAFHQTEGLPPATRASIALTRAHLPNLLARLDGATMAASVEGRVPYTDRDLIAFMRTSLSHDLSGTGNKELLRSTFADLLPGGALRRPKRPFDASLSVLFSSPAGQQEIDELYQTESLAELFAMDQLRPWLDRNRQSHTLQRLWLLVSLNRWLSRNIN